MLRGSDVKEREEGKRESDKGRTLKDAGGNEKERKRKEQGKAILLEGGMEGRNRKKRKKVLPDLKHLGSIEITYKRKYFLLEKKSRVAVI